MKNKQKYKVYIEDIWLVERDYMSKENSTEEKKEHRKSSSLRSGKNKQAHKKNITWSGSSTLSKFELTEEEIEGKRKSPEALDREYEEYKKQQELEKQNTSQKKEDTTEKSDATTVSSLTEPVEVDTFKSKSDSKEDIFKEKIYSRELLRKIKEAKFDKEFEELLEQGANPNFVEEADEEKNIKESRSLLSVTVDEYASRRQTLEKHLNPEKESQSEEQSNDSKQKIFAVRKELHNLRGIATSLMTANPEYPQLSKADPTLKLSPDAQSPLQRANEKLGPESSLTQNLQDAANKQILFTIYPNPQNFPALVNSSKIQANLEGGANPSATYQTTPTEKGSALNLAVHVLAKSHEIANRYKEDIEAGNYNDEEKPHLEKQIRRYEKREDSATKTIGALIEKGADIYERPSPNSKSALELAEQFFTKDSIFTDFLIQKQAEREGYVRERPAPPELKPNDERLYDIILPPGENQEYPPIIDTDQLSVVLRKGANPNFKFEHSATGKEEPILNLVLDIHEDSRRDNAPVQIDASREAIGILISNGASIYDSPSSDVMSPFEKAKDLFGPQDHLVNFMELVHNQKEAYLRQKSERSIPQEESSLSNDTRASAGTESASLSTSSDDSNQERSFRERVGKKAPPSSEHDSGHEQEDKTNTHASRVGQKDLKSLTDGSNRGSKDADSTGCIIS